MDNVTIQSSCGHTLLPGQTATLTAVIDSPSPQNYRFMWQKKNLKGELLNWVEYGQTIQINSDEVSEDITYIVSVIGGQDIITDSSNNILTDTTGNILTASFTLYTSEHDVYNAQENDEIVPYVQELTLNQNIYDAYDKILYYTSSMMPTVEHEEVTATTEADKLTLANLSPVGLQKVTTSTSVATVNTALKMLAKVFVKSGYVKVDVDTDNTNTYF